MTKARSAGPVCIESFGGRMCREPATHEVRIADLDPTWDAKCPRCVRFYNPKCVQIRELTPKRSDAHELAQWREGTLLHASHTATETR